MDMATELPPLIELITALEQATLMAKQLSTTADSSHLHQIYSSLHSAHHRLSSFLSLHPTPPPPALPPPPENSVSSAAGNSAGGFDGDDPMEDGDEAEENSKAAIERVEERMRDCFIQNKRPKRSLSPAAAAAWSSGIRRRMSRRGSIRREES
ncbi:hypothetical protein NMG60_11029102 [Bertholletia excelsa]